MSHGCISDVVPFVCSVFEIRNSLVVNKIFDSGKYISDCYDEIETEDNKEQVCSSGEEQRKLFLLPQDGWEFIEDESRFGNKKRLYKDGFWKKTGTEFAVVCFNSSQYSNVGELEPTAVSINKESLEEFVKDFSVYFTFSDIEETDSVEQWL